MSYNPFKVGSSTFRPSGPVERKKAEQVIEEVYNLKDEFVKFDNTKDDTDRKRGSVELLSRQMSGGKEFALGNIEFDSYTEEKDLFSLNVGVSGNEGCDKGTFVIDKTTRHYGYTDIRNNGGKVETEIFFKHDRGTKLYQSVYRDVETGQIMYKEEER
ncbi:MAG: hypothetical protein BWY64_03180 [bacterium ADurb.Bin363]|nr:MAG: hypothetical protein BWY64_03180 [bacterium ADurb.Bin363]